MARGTAGVPLIATRDKDGVARVFRNACRHRGMPVAEGAGCKRVLVCPYHAWTYELDGSLRGVPHEDGFPGLDKRSNGLVPVSSFEDQGLIWVTQDGTVPARSPWAELDGLVTPAQRLVGTSEQDLAANWKIVAEGFLEGYHLQSLHGDTFFPIQFDNLNVIEQFGPNSRVTFPYRRVDKLREVPAEERSADGVLTYVYHLFPNVMLVTFSKNTTMIVIEPLAVDRTRLVTYTLTHRDASKGVDREALERDLRFIDAGTVQDREAAMAIQRGLASRGERGVPVRPVRERHRPLPPHAARRDRRARRGARTLIRQVRFAANSTESTSPRQTMSSRASVYQPASPRIGISTPSTWR